MKSLFTCEYNKTGLGNILVDIFFSTFDPNKRMTIQVSSNYLSLNPPAIHSNVYF